jgi:rhodanese-related sulfurtransferase
MNFLSTSAHWRVWATAISLYICSSVVSSEEEILNLPVNEPGATTLTAFELATRMREKEPLVVIDARIAQSRKKGYIEGSSHLPDIDTHCGTLTLLAPNKSTPLAFYCSSTRCGRSLNTVRIALSCGYTKIYWFRGGFEEWKSNGFPYRIDDAS